MATHPSRQWVAVLVLAVLGAQAATVRQVLRVEEARANLLKPAAWQPWDQGFAQEDGLLVCANGTDAQVQRGAGQVVVLDQTRPQPIVATAWSRAEGVTGGKNSDYSLYLDILYTDGTPQWGQISPFNTGTHDWEKRQVVFFPVKPIKHVSFYVLLRRHGGTAWFRDPQLRELSVPEGCSTFDAVPVLAGGKGGTGLLLRDLAADSDFLDADGAAELGLQVTVALTAKGKAE